MTTIESASGGLKYDRDRLLALALLPQCALPPQQLSTQITAPKLKHLRPLAPKQSDHSGAHFTSPLSSDQANVDFTGPHVGFYLAAQLDPPKRYPTLDAAQAAARALGGLVGGITLSKGAYELRKGTVLKPSHNHETSYCKVVVSSSKATTVRSVRDKSVTDERDTATDWRESSATAQSSTRQYGRNGHNREPEWADEDLDINTVTFEIGAGSMLTRDLNKVKEAAVAAANGLANASKPQTQSTPAAGQTFNSASVVSDAPAKHSAHDSENDDDLDLGLASYRPLDASELGMEGGDEQDDYDRQGGDSGPVFKSFAALMGIPGLAAWGTGGSVSPPKSSSTFFDLSSLDEGDDKGGASTWPSSTTAGATATRDSGAGPSLMRPIDMSSLMRPLDASGGLARTATAAPVVAAAPIKSEPTPAPAAGAAMSITDLFSLAAASGPLPPLPVGGKLAESMSTSSSASNPAPSSTSPSVQSQAAPRTATTAAPIQSVFRLPTSGAQAGSTGAQAASSAPGASIQLSDMFALLQNAALPPMPVMPGPMASAPQPSGEPSIPAGEKSDKEGMDNVQRLFARAKAQQRRVQPAGPTPPSPSPSPPLSAMPSNQINAARRSNGPSLSQSILNPSLQIEGLVTTLETEAGHHGHSALLNYPQRQPQQQMQPQQRAPQSQSQPQQPHYHQYPPSQHHLLQQQGPPQGHPQGHPHAHALLHGQHQQHAQASHQFLQQFQNPMPYANQPSRGQPPPSLLPHQPPPQPYYQQPGFYGEGQPHPQHFPRRAGAAPIAVPSSHAYPPQYLNHGASSLLHRPPAQQQAPLPPDQLRFLSSLGAPVNAGLAPRFASN